MKIWELDWTEGRQYKNLHPYFHQRIWTVKEGSLVDELGKITEIYNLEIISQFDFEPVVDWSKVKVDTKVRVSISNGTLWARRHFAKYEDGKVYVFDGGQTSWTTNKYSDWNNAVLVEESEEE